MKTGVKKQNQPDYEIPYAESQYELPYENSVENETQNEEIYDVYHSDRDSVKYETYERAEYEEYNIKNKTITNRLSILK